MTFEILYGFAKALLCLMMGLFVAWVFLNLLSGCEQWNSDNCVSFTDFLKMYHP